MFGSYSPQRARRITDFDEVPDAAADDEGEREVVAVRCHLAAEEHVQRGQEADGHDDVEDDGAEVRREFVAEGEEGAGVLGVDERDDVADVVARHEVRQRRAHDPLRGLIEQQHGGDDGCVSEAFHSNHTAERRLLGGWL